MTIDQAAAAAADAPASSFMQKDHGTTKTTTTTTDGQEAASADVQGQTLKKVPTSLEPHNNAAAAGAVTTTTTTASPTTKKLTRRYLAGLPEAPPVKVMYSSYTPPPKDKTVESVHIATPTWYFVTGTLSCCVYACLLFTIPVVVILVLELNTESVENAGDNFQVP